MNIKALPKQIQNIMHGSTYKYAANSGKWDYGIKAASLSLQSEMNYQYKDGNQSPKKFIRTERLD
jgi:hypothetical protein